MEVLYNFNTSNVFIYHMAEWTGYPPEDNFNTSNVFVYPTFLSHSSVSIISLNLDIFNVFQLFSQPAVHFQN